MTVRAKILIVEDDPLIAMEMSERLEDMGYEILGPAHTVEDGARLGANQRPDAALLDANLHGKSSVELGVALAASGVPIAFCTGYDEIKGLPAHLAKSPVLTKPIPDDQLKAALEKMLKK